MQRSTGAKVTATSYSGGFSNQKYTFRSPKWMRSLVQTASGARTGSQPYLPQPNACSAPATATPVAIGMTTVPQESVHLMACLQRGRYRRIVRQDPIDGITTDKALFCFLRSQLAQHRGRVRRFFSLKCVQGLLFVKVCDLNQMIARHPTATLTQHKFQLKICGSALIRDHEPYCTNSASRKCECIPPASKVTGQDPEYRCNPAGPLDWGPPIPSQALMHMITSPDCIHEDDDFVFKQLPKKLKGELKGEAG